MKSPQELYDYYKSTIPNIEAIAYDKLFKNYILRNLKGKDKQINLEDTDQESLLIKKNEGFPIPGLIYTFIYKARELSAYQDGNKIQKFLDYTPLVFCMSNQKDKATFRGLNLNMMPASSRCDFLDTYYNFYKEFFINIENLTETNKEAINKDFINYIISKKPQRMINYFNSQCGVKFENAYRTYNIKYIENFRMIEYAEWWLIPFYKPKDAFPGNNFENIQKQFINNSILK